MRRLGFVAALLFATELHAGVIYRFESVTGGLTTHTFAGTVKADDGKARIDVASGDGLLFGNNSVVLSSAVSPSVTVIDPAKKTFYELDVANLLARSSGALSQLGNLVKVDARNPRVVVRDAGAAGLMQGYAVRRSHVVSSFDLIVNAFGEKSPARVEVNTDIWTTDKLPAAFANVLLTSKLKTGIAAIDRLIEAQTSSLHGFPLKQVTTTRVTLRGSTTTSTTTSTVSAIRQTALAPSEFALPRGFRKVENPVEAMLNRFSVNR